MPPTLGVAVAEDGEALARRVAAVTLQQLAMTLHQVTTAWNTHRPLEDLAHGEHRFAALAAASVWVPVRRMLVAGFRPVHLGPWIRGRGRPLQWARRA